jgi:hypothetical protein
MRATRNSDCLYMFDSFMDTCIRVLFFGKLIFSLTLMIDFRLEKEPSVRKKFFFQAIIFNWFRRE